MIGFLFAGISGLLGLSAYLGGGASWTWFWPSLSFGVVGLAYLGAGSRPFGKTEEGRLSWISKGILAPYLALVWGLWHAVRRVRRGPAYAILTENLWIGRRLLGSELPEEIRTVVDLTCELELSPPSRRVVYRTFPILDASAPTPEQLWRWVQEITSLEGPVYLHCAEGHGRTGLVASALLLQQGLAENAESALSKVQSVRPRVRLSGRQLRVLKEMSQFV